MKIVVTGALGNVSLPLTRVLVEKGHEITVISRDINKKEAITTLGALPAIGQLEYTAFLTGVFESADAVYTMIPPGDFSDPQLDLIEYYTGIAHSISRSVKQSGIKSVVHLSSIGAHLKGQTGLISAHRQAEEILSALPNVNITFLRPAAFYYNLKFFVPMIKSAGVIRSNYGGEDTVFWAAPKDVAQAAAQALLSVIAGRNIRYIVSEQISCNDTAGIIGKAIGKPALEWQVIPGECMLAIFGKAGLNPQFAKSLIEMNCRIADGSLYEDFTQHPSKPGKEKLADFAKEFAAVYYG